MTIHDPTTCYVCTRHATGIGLGLSSPRDKDPRWLCAECVLILEQVKNARRPSVYELKAREGGMEAAGDYLESLGKTDLAEFEEEEALMLVGRIWDGCAKRLRHLITTDSAPF